MKQKPFTKTQRRNVRENTYRVEERQVCQNCKWCWEWSWLYQCHAVELRGKIEVMKVASNGTCDLWERREEATA